MAKKGTTNRAPAQPAPQRQLTVPEQAVKSLRTDAALKALKAVLPKGMPLDRFVSIAAAEIKSPNLARVTEPSSIIMGVYHAAKLGLSLNPHMGEAHLVPFADSKNNRTLAVFMPGYKGLAKLARQGGIKSITPTVVHEKDEFDYTEDETGVHYTFKPCDDDDPGPVKAVITRAVDDEGNVTTLLLRRKELLATKNRAMAKTRGTGPWKTHEEAMYFKTGVRRICKILPQSENVAAAIHHDEVFEGAPLDSDVPQDLVDAGVVDADYTEVVGAANQEQQPEGGKPEIDEMPKAKSEKEPEQTEPEPEQQAEEESAKPDPGTPLYKFVSGLMDIAAEKGIEGEALDMKCVAEFGLTPDAMPKQLWPKVTEYFKALPAAG